MFEYRARTLLFADLAREGLHIVIFVCRGSWLNAPAKGVVCLPMEQQELKVSPSWSRTEVPVGL